jgi:hypothetical protein
MQVDEIRAMVASMQIPQPPVTAADGSKLQWLTVQLLQEIACQLANANATKGDS